MLVSQIGGYPASRRSLNKADLHQIRFIDVFQGRYFLGNGVGQGFHADRSALESFDDAAYVALVDIVQSQLVDLQAVQRQRSYLVVYDAVLIEDLGKVPYPSEQAVGDTRGPTASGRQFLHGSLFDLRIRPGWERRPG